MSKSNCINWIWTNTPKKHLYRKCIGTCYISGWGGCHQQVLHIECVGRAHVDLLQTTAETEHPCSILSELSDPVQNGTFGVQPSHLRFRLPSWTLGCQRAILDGERGGGIRWNGDREPQGTSRDWRSTLWLYICWQTSCVGMPLLQHQ